MHKKWGVRLIPLFPLFAGATLLVSICLTATYIFSSYIKSLQIESQHILYKVASFANMPSSHNNALKIANLVAQRDFTPTMLVTLIDQQHRITILQHRKNAHISQAIVIERDRDDRSGEPQAKGLAARFILGSAAIAGLQIVRAHTGDIDIYVKDNDPVVVAATVYYFPAFMTTLLISLIASYLVSNVLSRQALQPLIDVTVALEKLARGDFTPRQVSTTPNNTLARLAQAYNAAGIAVQNAIDERERANRTMRNFAADAGHQLKTPLTIVRGRVGILTTHRDETINQHERSISVIDSQCALMAELIENLMLLDRWEQEREHPVAVPVDVVCLLTDIISVFCETFPDRQITVVNKVEGAALVLIEPREFTFIITNVIDNALKYTTGNINVAISNFAKTVSLSISDDGPGMPEKVKERVFDRFFRGPRREIDGSGLGLPIARAAIERASGIINIESLVATGSVVTMQLPIVQGRAAL